MSGLREGWETRSIGDIALVITGSTPKASENDSWGDYLDFVTPSDQILGQRDATPARRLSRVGADRLARRIVPKLSTNLTCIGSTIGKVSMASRDCVTNQQINSLVAIDGVSDPRFIYYLISNWSYSLGSAASGSATPIVNKSVLSGFRFEIPLIGDQKAISEVLGALDDKIAVNRNMASTSHELAGIVFEQSSITIPNVRMSDVLDPILGGTPTRSSSEYWGGEVPWASAKDVAGAQDGVVLATEESITNYAATSTKCKPLASGGVIITARGTVGAVARVVDPTAFNQSCYGFEPGIYSPAVLYFAVRRATERAKEYAHGSVFGTITKATFNSFEMPDPVEIGLAGIEDRVAPILKASELALIESQSLAAIRDTLLPQLMSGKLRVRDAEKQVEAVL